MNVCWLLEKLGLKSLRRPPQNWLVKKMASAYLMSKKPGAVEYQQIETCTLTINKEENNYE